MHTIAGIIAFLDAHAGAVTSIATIILVILTGRYVQLTARQATVAQRQTQFLIEQQVRERARNGARLFARVCRLIDDFEPLLSIDDHDIQSSQFLKPWNDDDVSNIDVDAASYDPEAIEPASDLDAALARMSAHAQYVHQVCFVGGGDANPQDQLTTADWKQERDKARAAMMSLASLSSPHNRKSIPTTGADSQKLLPNRS